MLVYVYRFVNTQAIVSFFIHVEISNDPFGLILQFGYFIINIMLLNIGTILRVNDDDKC